MLLGVLLGLFFVSETLGQSLVKQADRQHELMAYAKAIELYEEALIRSFLTDTEREHIFEKLGDSYRKVQNPERAEEIYRELLKSRRADEPASAVFYLHYAQVLAINGKYEEAQKAYDVYSNLSTHDQRGKSFSRLYRDVSVLTRNAASYQVHFLDFNTQSAEFSPMYFREKVVFVSNRRESGAIRRVFTWDNTPFLDLFEMPLKALAAGETGAAGGGQEPRTARRERLVRPLGSDDYTANTSNDSRTAGSWNVPSKTQTYRYEKEEQAREFNSQLNSRYHEGPVAFTKDFSKIYFTRNNYSKGQYGESKDGVNKLKIYVAQATRNGWTDEQSLSFNSEEYSCGHPTLGPDDKVMIFVSDKPGGQGGTDLYLSRYAKGHWSKPVNLGETVNTKGNEMFPFLDEFGNLYFASDGHAGLGGLDLFYTTLSPEGVPGKVYNLGAPLNSRQDDFGIITDGQRQAGFFSSNRRNGGTDDDIYRFRREGPLYPCRELSLSVIDAESKEPLPGATVDLGNNLTAEDSRKLTLDSTGLARICLDPESDFVMAASAAGYQSSTVGFSTRDLADDLPIRIEIPLQRAKPQATLLKGRVLAQKDSKPLPNVRVVLKSDCDSTARDTLSAEDGTYAFLVRPDCNYQIEAYGQNMATTGGRVDTTGTAATELRMLTKGDVVAIDNIYYDLNKWTIRPDAAAELNKLAELMKKYPKMRIELRSHTDSRASASFNRTLSTRRAIAAVSYLRRQGIAGKRMVAAGYGESKLLNPCRDGVTCSEEEHQQNRRTEFKILALE